MNEIQCIKWFGLDHAKYLIKEKINGHDHEFTLEDLKRLVESVDMINSIGGIKFAKAFIAVTGSTMGNTLEQAIADYEAIYSNDCETLDHQEDYTSPNCKKFDEQVK